MDRRSFVAMVGAALVARPAPAETSAAGRARVRPWRRPSVPELLIFGQVPGRLRLSFFADEDEPRFGAATAAELSELHADLVRACGRMSTNAILDPDWLPAKSRLCGVIDFQLPTFPAIFDEPVGAWMRRMPGRHVGSSRARCFEQTYILNDTERLSAKFDQRT